MKARELIARLEADGWFLVRGRGSHRQYHHRSKHGTVTVSAKLNVDVPVGTLKSVSKQAGIKLQGVAMHYLVVIEKGPSSFGAYVPDLPGCVAAADTHEAVVALISEAIEFHIHGLAEDGKSIPLPSSSSVMVEIKPAA